MWNIMKAQNYQIRGDNYIILVLLVGLLLPTCTVLIDFEISGLSGSLFLAQFGAAFPVILEMILILEVARICGQDAGDKTINYEILAGHSRAEVYFGRVIMSVIWGVGSGIVMLVLPVFGMTVLKGWGSSMLLGDAAVRCVLFLFPMFRLVCELVMLTFWLRDGYKAMLIGGVFYSISMVGMMMYEELTDNVLTVQLVVSNLMQVFDFDNYKLEYVGGEDIPVYMTAVDGTFAVSTVLVSLFVGGICLAAGYAVFKRQDMH